MFICKFCSQERKNSNSLRNHERLCALNPARQSTPFQDLVFQKQKCNNKSNQYIKAEQMGLPKPVISEEARKKLSDRNKARSTEWNKENGKRVSYTINKKVAAGTWHTSLSKHMHIDYNGVDLHGSWEVAYAQYLDSKNIAWSRCKESFAYEFEGTRRKYTPDFYLPETDEYVEVKGYKTAKDAAKWDQFPKNRKLVVLMKAELLALGIKLKN